MKRFVFIVTLIAVIVAALTTLGYAGYRYIDNYFKPNNNVISVFSEFEINLVIGDEIVEAEAPPLVIDEEVLLPVSVVKKFFDPNINWDEATSTVTITTEDRLIRMRTDNLDALINNEPLRLNVPVTRENDTVYIPIDFLLDFYEIEMTWLKSSRVVIIDYLNNIIQMADPIAEGAVVRTGRSIREPVICELSLDSGRAEENRLRVFKEYKDWYKVRTSRGEVGYIDKEYVVLTRMYMYEVPWEDKVTPPLWMPENGKISLVFDQFRTTRPDLANINMGESVDIVSPTWLDLQDAEGNIRNYSDKVYVDWAHQNNYQVWALVASFDADISHGFLNSLEARDNFIRQLLSYAALYEFDGINIDFENIYLSDKDALTQFVREITPLLREQGLIVSMDVGVPDGSENYSKCYDLSELSAVVDYLIIMTYDQHWSTSPVAGSVAQYTWVEDRLQRTLEMVPAEKLIMGMPFYIRLWSEEKNENNSVKVSSTAYSMNYITNLLEEKGQTVEWDEASGQYYAEFMDEDVLYKVWIEDENSIDLKTSLVHKYKLAGAAAWKRGLEEEEVWEVIGRNLKSIDSYFEWKTQSVWGSSLG